MIKFSLLVFCRMGSIVKEEIGILIIAVVVGRKGVMKIKIIMCIKCRLMIVRLWL
jgi:hypothetical protein